MISDLKNKRWIIISGKGGTGKTTLAASLGIGMAELGKKVLVVSLDPAHSLSDSYIVEIGSKITKIEDVSGELYGLEFDVKKAFKEERDKFRALSSEEDLASFGIDKDIIDAVSDLPTMPAEYFEGIGFIKLFNEVENSDFDIIIFDTAPTGHTLKLLELPDYLDTFLGKLLKFQLRFASIFQSIKRFFGFGGGEDRYKLMLEFLEETQKIVRDVKSKLTNGKLTEFIVVGLPAMMSLLESIRLVTELSFYGIPNNYIVINMVRIYGGDQCIFSKRMAKMHVEMLKEYMKEFPDKKLRVIPFFAEEIRGADKLKRILNYIHDFTPKKAIEYIEEEKTIE